MKTVGESFSYSFALNLLKWEEIVDTTSDAAEVAMGGAGGPSPAAPPAALKDSEIKMTQDMIAFKCSELEDPTTLIHALDPEDHLFKDPHLQILVLKNPLLVDKLISFLAHENTIIRLNTARIFTLLSTADPKIVACLVEHSGAQRELIALLYDQHARIQTASFCALYEMHLSCDNPEIKRLIMEHLVYHMKEMPDENLFKALCAYPNLNLQLIPVRDEWDTRDDPMIVFQNRVLRFMKKLEPLHELRLTLKQEMQRAGSSIANLFEWGSILEDVNKKKALALIKETEEYQRHSVVRPFSGPLLQAACPIPIKLGGDWDPHL